GDGFRRDPDRAAGEGAQGERGRLDRPDEGDRDVPREESRVSAKHAAVPDAAPLFAALGDATRMDLVARLGSCGPQALARLTRGSNITRQAVTKHLVVLADAGLVRSERRGRERHWELEPDALDIARRYLDHVSRQWDQRLSALARHLDASETVAGRRGKRRS